MIKGKYQPKNGFRVISKPRRLQSVRASITEHYCLVRRIADQYSNERVFFNKNGHRERVPSVRVVEPNAVRSKVNSNLLHRRTYLYSSRMTYQNFIQVRWYDPVFVPTALVPESWRMHFIKRASFYSGSMSHYSYCGYHHIALGHLPTKMVANRAQLAAFHARSRFHVITFAMRWFSKGTKPTHTSKRCGRDSWPAYYYIPKKNPDYLRKVKGPYRHKTSQR